MTEKPENPLLLEARTDSCGNHLPWSYITLRDLFALAHSMGLAALAENCNTHEQDGISAYKSADAALKAREQ